MRIVPLIVVAVFLTGCVTTASDNKLSQYKAEATAYIDCNIKASRIVALQEGDPISLGLAAQGVCAREELALTNALNRAHRPRVAARLIDDVRQDTVRSNASVIVKVRARATLR